MADKRKIDQKLLDDIKQYGWQVVMVPEDEQGPAFGYSVGLFKTYGHAEIILVGLQLDSIHLIINQMGEAIQNGKQYLPEQYNGDVLENYDCFMQPVDKALYSDYVGRAQWLYQGDDFPVLQCVYPNRQGYFPWQDECPPTFKEAQPLLGKAQ